MKIFYISGCLPHYYDLVLSKLNNIDGIEIIVVIPENPCKYIGEGVKHLSNSNNLKVIELKDYSILASAIYTGLKGLHKVLSTEKPDIVITAEPFLRLFKWDYLVIRSMRKFNIGLILKSIPFRFLPYDERFENIANTIQKINQFSESANRFLNLFGVIKKIKKIQLKVDKTMINIPDAHVNYVNACDIWSSYGVKIESIFVTGNSPDTDLLLATKKELKKTLPILSFNEYRIIHVGRLAQWKRVDMLIRAFYKILKNYPNAELIIIGEGQQEKTLKNLVSRLNIESNIAFIGGVHEPKLLGRYLMSSSLYVLAGMGGLSINDAMCFGLPIVCSICDGTEEILVKEGVNGRYFKDGDENDLCDKIKWFLDNKTKSKEMGKESVSIINKEVNVHTVIKGYLDAFDYVIKKKCK